MTDPWHVSRMQALWRAVRCLDEENALAALESAIHEKYLPVEAVRRIIRLAPRRLQSAARHLVTNSGSGLETIVRLRLIEAGHVVVAQPVVPGMGRGDLLVDDCINVEVDGRKWHGPEQLDGDQDRDLVAEGFGRHVIRIHAANVFATWPTTLAVIERAVSDARVNYERRFGTRRVLRENQGSAWA